MEPRSNRTTKPSASLYSSRMLLPTLSGAVLLALSSAAQAQGLYDLTFKPDKFTEQTITYNGKALLVRAYEKIVYVANPIDTVYQLMNVYIPADYFAGKSINGYTAQTAPIFFPNRIGGYMPATPATALSTGEGAPGGPQQAMPGGLPPGGPPPVVGRRG